MTSEPFQRFYVEFDPAPAEPCPVAFADDPVIVLFFQSWAYSLDFGGTHELAQAAQHLKTKQKVDLKPLLKYADRDVETPNDQRELDRSWQPAADLAACARAVAEAWIAPDDTLRPLIEGYAHLAPRLLELPPCATGPRPRTPRHACACRSCWSSRKRAPRAPRGTRRRASAPERRSVSAGADSSPN